MNFNEKSQSIHKYLDKLYHQLMKDAVMITEFDTLAKKCSLESSKLSNYVIAIKEELESEIVQSEAYKSLDEQSRKNLLLSIERVSQQQKIPSFILSKEECMDVVSVVVDRVLHRESSSGQAIEWFNMGTAIGTFVGIGVGFLVQKSLPGILIGSIGGAVLGTIMGNTTKKAQRKTPMERSTQKSSQQTIGKVNHHKFQSALDKRKALILPLFRLYINQLQEACHPILK